MNIKKMNKGLDFLRDKYGAAKGEITIKDGHCYVGATPLLPGRMERKIVELKKMTENGTLEGVSTLRFAAFAPKGADMEAMLAKELDLAAYLGASDVVRVMAAASGAAINVLAKLANDVNVSVEIGAGLPKGAEPYDRHEIIAKRGVACDQTVDTHTKHESIRCWGADGMAEYTDVDTELFGLSYGMEWRNTPTSILNSSGSPTTKSGTFARHSRFCRNEPMRRSGRPRGPRRRRPPFSRSPQTSRRPRRR